MRLNGYNYSWNGIYYLTVCTQKKSPLLWHNPGASIDRPVMDIRLPDDLHTIIDNPPLSYIGLAVEKGIQSIHAIYSHVTVDKYIIMPDHIHMIIKLSQDYNEIDKRKRPSLSTVINQLKGYVTRQIGYSIWQKSFFDHIVRNEVEYAIICKYIDNNPKVFGEELLRLTGISIRKDEDKPIENP